MPINKFPAKPNMPNILESDCEKARSLADGYLRDGLGLSEADSGFFDGHIGECAGCLDFVESESRYIEAMAQASYEPQSSISQFVMGKIARGEIAIEKPPKKIFVPFGLISAAAIVLAMFVASRSGALEIFTKSNENAAADSGAGRANAVAKSFEDAEMAFDEFGGIEEFLEMEAPIPAAEPNEDHGYGTGDAPVRGNLFGDLDESGFWEANRDLAIEFLYRIDLGGASIGDILKDIEIYRADQEGAFYIVGMQHRETLEKNMGEIGINAKAETDFDADEGQADEKYIGILIMHNA